MRVTAPYLMFNISIALISIRIWSNSLYNSRRNQINIALVTILRLLFHKSNHIKSNQILVFAFLLKTESKCNYKLRRQNKNKHYKKTTEISSKAYLKQVLLPNIFCFFRISFRTLCSFFWREFRFNKLEISIPEAVTTQYWLGLWSAE